MWAVEGVLVGSLTSVINEHPDRVSRSGVSNFPTPNAWGRIDITF